MNREQQTFLRSQRLGYIFIFSSFCLRYFDILVELLLSQQGPLLHSQNGQTDLIKTR